MKKSFLLAACLAAALGLTGCVQLKSDTVIENDGSGTASVSFSLSPSMIGVLEEMQALDMDQNQDMDLPSFEDINREDLEKAAQGHGVEITKFEKTMTNEREQLDIVLAFKDLEGLSYVMGDLMGGETGNGMGIYETADGNLVLKKTQYDFPAEADDEDIEDDMDEMAQLEEEDEYAAEEEGAGDEEAMTPEKAQKQMELMGKLMGSLSELDVKFTITVPGAIIESNAPTVEGNTSIWSMNSSNMMSMQGQTMDPVIKFSGKGLKIKALKE